MNLVEPAVSLTTISSKTHAQNHTDHFHHHGGRLTLSANLFLHSILGMSGPAAIETAGYGKEQKALQLRNDFRGPILSVHMVRTQRHH